MTKAATFPAVVTDPGQSCARPIQIRIDLVNGAPRLTYLDAAGQEAAAVQFDYAGDRLQIIAWDHRGMQGADGNITLGLDDTGIFTTATIADMTDQPGEPIVIFVPRPDARAT